MKLFDRWSFIHIASGIFMGACFFALVQWYAVLPTFGLASLWEVFENTQCGVNMMKFLGDTEFNGDTKRHSVADIFGTTLGGVIACSVASSLDTPEEKYGTNGALIVLLFLLYFILLKRNQCTPDPLKESLTYVDNHVVG